MSDDDLLVFFTQFFCLEITLIISTMSHSKLKTMYDLPDEDINDLRNRQWCIDDIEAKKRKYTKSVLVTILREFGDNEMKNKYIYEFKIINQSIRRSEMIDDLEKIQSKYLKNQFAKNSVSDHDLNSDVLSNDDPMSNEVNGDFIHSNNHNGSRFSVVCSMFLYCVYWRSRTSRRFMSFVNMFCVLFYVVSEVVTA